MLGKATPDEMVPVGSGVSLTGAVSLRRDIDGCSRGDLITGVVSLRVGLTVVGGSIDAR